MFANKVIEYVASNRALQSWHRLKDEEVEILKDFAAWLDENAAEHKMHPTAFGARLAWLFFGFILVLAMVLVIIGVG